MGGLAADGSAIARTPSGGGQSVRKRMSHIFKERERLSVVFERVYQPFLRSRAIRWGVMLVSVIVLVVGCLGLTTMEIGLDLEDLFPADTQSYQFIVTRMAAFPVWPCVLVWGELKYTDPWIQMKMVWQWEGVTSSTYIVPGLKTNSMWVASFAEWALRVDANGPERKCKAVWAKNVFKLKLRENGGYCHRDLEDRSMPKMECNNTYGCCPVVAGPYNAETGLGSWEGGLDGLADGMLSHCISKWADSGNDYALASPGFPLEEGSNYPSLPIRLSRAGGTNLFAINLFKTSDYTNLLKETRAFVDDDLEVHSWMGGVAYNYWEQYLEIESFLLTIAGYACAGGFGCCYLFLFVELTMNYYGHLGQRLVAVAIGSLLIVLVMAASIATVLGFTAWAGVQLSAFTAISALLASGFAIEYAVHVVHHFLECQDNDVVDRSVHAMAFLFVPTAMSFFSSTISVIPLALSGFTFVTRFFFTPLMFVVIITYFYGAITLPFLLSLMRCMPVLEKRNKQEEAQEAERERLKGGAAFAEQANTFKPCSSVDSDAGAGASSRVSRMKREGKVDMNASFAEEVEYVEGQDPAAKKTGRQVPDSLVNLIANGDQVSKQLDKMLGLVGEGVVAPEEDDAPKESTVVGPLGEEPLDDAGAGTDEV